MAESIMMNCRLKAEEVERIDAVAKQMGMSRSEFTRKALSEALAKYTAEDTPVTGVQVRGKAKKGASKYKYDGCPSNPQCQFVKAPTGVKICTSCGVKRA